MVNWNDPVARCQALRRMRAWAECMAPAFGAHSPAGKQTCEELVSLCDWELREVPVKREVPRETRIKKFQSVRSFENRLPHADD